MGTTTAPPCLRLRSDDTVGVMTGARPAGAEIVVGDLVVRLVDDVPAGHKVALADVPTGGQVRKYNQVIGVATRPIHIGEHVHSHNLAFADFGRDYAFGQDLAAAGRAPIEPSATFKGIVRASGQVATRNYVGILTSVNCSATVARMVAAQFGEGPSSWPSTPTSTASWL